MSKAPSPDMIARRDASQATLDRFAVKPLKLGVSDCVRMVAFHLRKLGYRVKLPPAGAYRTIRAAKRIMLERGYENLAAALDDLGLARIAPAEAIVGDILQLPGNSEFGALTIAMGNGRVCGFHEAATDRGAVVMQPTDYAGAWRVQPA